eukprot:TRINITY_DN10710_c0_g1_i1.p1 TRINITY_DN10710_c0_g1~~TRINITY_DN10710_c0_g1_i1.p1  ORF type:complete len:133 (+),score=19.17 TRINITY_DN10710_c0_g1_i1:93-491(+)
MGVEYECPNCQSCFSGAQIYHQLRSERFDLNSQAYDAIKRSKRSFRSSEMGYGDEASAMVVCPVRAFCPECDSRLEIMAKIKAKVIVDLDFWEAEGVEEALLWSIPPPNSRSSVCVNCQCDDDEGEIMSYYD